MKFLGSHFSRKVYWLNFDQYRNQLPESDWICLAIANEDPMFEKAHEFCRSAILSNISEFKGHGKYGERLHDIFDETMIIMEAEYAIPIDISSTSHNDEPLMMHFGSAFLLHVYRQQQISKT